MGDHTAITDLCARIMNYYYIIAHKEYLLPNNQRIDLVGYSRNKKEPDIGIEVELTSDLSKDASKLLTRQPTANLRIIVSNKPDTISLNRISNGDKIIEVVRPPDEDIAFEELIRKYMGLENRSWYNAKKWDVYTKEESEDILKKFERDIGEQGLDINTAKDVVFKCALGGIFAGEYQLRKYDMQFYSNIEIPKELLYLEARGIIFESRPGRNYYQGRASVYYTSENARALSLTIIKERVEKKSLNVKSIQGRYRSTKLMVSLLGQMGSFIDRTDYELNTASGDSRYMGVSLPIFSTPQDIPRDLVEKFNISSQVIYATRICSSSPLFRDIVRQVYSDLVNAGIGNITESLGTGSEHYGKQYFVPLRSILEKLNIAGWPDIPVMNAIRNYAAWIIIRAHNPSVPATMYDSFKLIGLGRPDIESRIKETADAGITSKFINPDAYSSNERTFAIYDDNKFNDFSEMKIRKSLDDVLKY